MSLDRDESTEQDLADEPANLYFEFWLNDIEAERLFQCINHDIVRDHQDILRRMTALGKDLSKETAESDPYIMSYRGSIRALEELMTKLHNERVEIEPKGLSSEAKSRIHHMAQEARASGEGIYYPNGPPTVDGEEEDEPLKEFSPGMKEHLRNAADRVRKTGEHVEIHGPPVTDDPRAAVEEQLEEDNDALFADGFDRAILGLGTQFTKDPVVVYDWDKCVEVLMEQGMSPEEAVEHMDFNVTGAWVGERTPIFVRRVR